MSKVKIEVKTEEIGKRYCGICGSELLVTILGAGHIPREIFDTETPYNEKQVKGNTQSNFSVLIGDGGNYLLIMIFLMNYFQTKKLK